MTENIAVDRIYCGDMTDLLPPLRPVIRVYLASNFTDMVMEKTELVNHIFPVIRNYCKDRHGLDFQVPSDPLGFKTRSNGQVVDMRWGVRDEATDDHMTTRCTKSKKIKHLPPPASASNS